MGQFIPTRESCDQDDPRTKFAWMFVAWPFIGDETFTPSDELVEKWSKRVDDLALVDAERLRDLADENGFIHVDQLPTPKIKLLKANRGPDHTINGLSGWVGIDEPEPEPVIIPDVGVYTRYEQEIIKEQLRYHGVVKDEEPKTPTARVNLGPLFDPSEHTPSTVNGYLMGCDSQGNDAEIRRVIAAEMAGKHRQQILRKWPGQ